MKDDDARKCFGWQRRTITLGVGIIIHIERGKTFGEGGGQGTKVRCTPCPHGDRGATNKVSWGEWEIKTIYTLVPDGRVPREGALDAMEATVINTHTHTHGI